MRNYYQTGLFSLLLLLCTVYVNGQMTVNVASTQNFDTLASTGTNTVWTDNSTIVGVYSSRTTYNAGTGSTNTGALYSFGSTGSSERALGSVGSGGTGAIVWGIRLRNDTGVQITSIDLSFVGEQWRNGGVATAQTLTFDYQISATPFSNLTSGTYTAVNSFDFTSPIFSTTSGALDGNLAANRTTKSGTIAVILNAGDEIMLRWTDIDHTGADHGLAIDDVSVTPHVTATAANVSISGRVMTSSGRGISNAVITLRDIRSNSSIFVRSSSFGHYKFDGLVAGETYVLSVGAKQHIFEQPAQTIVPGDNLYSVDFIAN